MSHAQYYPRADTAAQNFYAAYPALWAPSRFMADVNLLVLHTTEGNGWEGYASGTMAPTFTYDPRSHQMRQHFPVNMAGRALVDPGVGTNRNNCAQIEIIGHAAQGGPLDAQAIADLGALVSWLHQEWSVPLVAPYAFTVPAHRMSLAEWTACRGVVGHEHVYGNDHWDPGAMNVDAILNAAHSGSGAGGVVSGTVHIPGAPMFPDQPMTITQEDDMIVRVITNPADGPDGKQHFDYIVGPAGVHYLAPDQVQLMRDYLSGALTSANSGQMGVISALLSYVTPGK
jgi:hypothetical protein